MPDDEDLLVKKYWHACYKFALVKGLSDFDSKDFAQSCWIWKFHLNWQSTKAQLLKHYHREKSGSRGSLKLKIESAIKFRIVEKNLTVSSPPGKKTNILEDLVPSPDENYLIKISSLSERQNILIFLIEAGWTLEELHSLFPEIKIKEEFKKIKMILAESLEAEELFGKTMEKEEDQLKTILRTRKFKQKILDLNFEDFEIS